MSAESHLPSAQWRSALATLTAVAVLAGGCAGAIASLITTPEAVRAERPPASAQAAAATCPNAGRATPPETASELEMMRWCTYIWSVRGQASSNDLKNRVADLKARVDKLNGVQGIIYSRTTALKVQLAATQDRLAKVQTQLQKTYDGAARIGKQLTHSSGRSLSNVIGSIAAKLKIHGFR